MATIHQFVDTIRVNNIEANIAEYVIVVIITVFIHFLKFKLKLESELELELCYFFENFY